MNIYKLFICYTHSVNGKMGRIMEFPAKSDAYASGVGSGEFTKDENSHFAVLVRKDKKEEIIITTYEHQIF